MREACFFPENKIENDWKNWKVKEQSDWDGIKKRLHKTSPSIFMDFYLLGEKSFF